MQDFTVNILGAEWSVRFGDEKDYPVLKNADGVTDSSTRELIVHNMDSSRGQVGAKRDLDAYRRKVLRHEIIHAFLYESGLGENSNTADMWALNEEMIDWLAFQIPKIISVMQKAGAL